MFCDTLKDAVFALSQVGTEVWTPLKVPSDVIIEDMGSMGEDLAVSSFGRFKQRDKLLTFSMENNSLLCENNDLVTAMLAKYKLQYIIYTAFFNVVGVPQLSVNTDYIQFKKIVSHVNPFRLGNLKVTTSELPEKTYIEVCETYVETYMKVLDNNIPLEDSTGECLYNIIPPDAPNAEELIKAATSSTVVPEKSPLSVAQVSRGHGHKRKKEEQTSTDTKQVEEKSVESECESEIEETAPDPSSLFLAVAGSDAVQPCDNSVVTAKEKKIEFDEEDMQKRRLERIRVAKQIAMASKDSKGMQERLERLSAKQKALEEAQKTEEKIAKPAEPAKPTTQESVAQPKLVSRGSFTPAKPPVSAVTEKSVSLVTGVKYETTSLSDTAEKMVASESTNVAKPITTDTTVTDKKQEVEIKSELGSTDTPVTVTDEAVVSDEKQKSAESLLTETTVIPEATQKSTDIKPLITESTAVSEQMQESAGQENVVVPEKLSSSDEVKENTDIPTETSSPAEVVSKPEIINSDITADTEEKNTAKSGSADNCTNETIEGMGLHHIRGEKDVSSESVIALTREEHEQITRGTHSDDLTESIADSWAVISSMRTNQLFDVAHIYTPSANKTAMPRLCDNKVNVEPVYNTVSDFILVAGRTPAERLLDFTEHNNVYAICEFNLKDIQNISIPLRRYLTDLIVQHSDCKLSPMTKLSLLSKQPSWVDGRIYFAHRISNASDAGITEVLDHVLNLMNSYPAYVTTMGENAVWCNSPNLFTFYFDSLPICTVKGLGVLNGLLKYIASRNYLYRCEFERVSAARIGTTYETVHELTAFIDDYLVDGGFRVYVKPIYSEECFTMLSTTLNEYKDWLRPLSTVFTIKTVPDNLRISAKAPAELFRFDVYDPVTKEVICTFNSVKTCQVYMGSVEAMNKALLGERDSSLGLKLHCCREGF